MWFFGAFVPALVAHARADEAVSNVEPLTTWSPLRVSLTCESTGRVEACTYVGGFLDASELFRSVPRGADQVRLIVGVTSDADVDRVLLRFVPAAPGVITEHQVVQPVSSRAGTDAQRATLEQAFNRGIAPYLVQVNPDAVTVTLSVPERLRREDVRSSPWGGQTWLGGWGSWTAGYRDLSLWAGQSVSWTTERARFGLWGEGHFDVSRSPSLEVDGTSISLDSDAWNGQAALLLARHISDRWSVGLVARGGAEDPDGQYAGTGKVHVGISHDWFASDDPRGNQLSVTWLIGGQADAYNATNQLGEDTAIFVSQLLVAKGTVRTDHAAFELSARLASELPDLLERNLATLSGTVSLTVGAHVDVSFESAVTRRSIPGPATVDTSSFEAITQADYAEPLSVEGKIALTLHWDKTNGVRNNRFAGPGELTGTESL